MKSMVSKPNPLFQLNKNTNLVPLPLPNNLVNKECLFKRLLGFKIVLRAQYLNYLKNKGNRLNLLMKSMIKLFLKNNKLTLQLSLIK